jgi:hypothetical protein
LEIKDLRAHKVIKEIKVLKDSLDLLDQSAYQDLLDSLELRARLEQPVQLVPLGLLDNKVTKVHKGRLVPLDQLELLVITVNRATRDNKEVLAIRDLRVLKETVDRQDLLDYLVTLDQLETRDHLVMLVHKDHKATLVHQDKRVPSAQPEERDPVDHLGPKVRKVKLGQSAIRVILDLLGLLVRKVIRDHKDSLAMLDHRDSKDLQVNLEVKVNLDRMGNQGPKVLLEMWAHRAIKDSQVRPAWLGPKDKLEIQDRLETQVPHQITEVNKERRAQPEISVTRVSRDRWVQMGHQGPMVIQVLREVPAFKGSKVQLAPRDNRVIQVHLDLRVTKVLQEMPEVQDRKVQPVHQDPQVQLETQVRLVKRDQMELLETLAQRDHKDSLARPVHRVRQDHLDKMAPQGHLDLREIRASLDHQEQTEIPVQLETLDLRALKDRSDHLDQPVNQELMVQSV